MSLHRHSNILKPKANLKRVLHTIHLHSDSPEHKHKKTDKLLKTQLLY